MQISEQTLDAIIARAVSETNQAPEPSVSQSAIVKWAAGIAGSIVAGYFMLQINQINKSNEQQFATDKRQDEAIIELVNAQAMQTQVQTQRLESIEKQLERIDSNTRDRITKTEAEDEIARLREDLAEVSTLANKSMAMLLDRNAFMLETKSEIERIDDRVSRLENGD